MLIDDINIISLLIVGVGAYLIGSIPFGLLLTRIMGKADLRTQGSGNIGATNVFRTSGKGLGVLTFLCDGGKGVLAVWLATIWFPSLIYMAAIAVVVGHIFPCWLRFKGGKGVATYFGVLLGLDWQLAVISMFIWVVVIILFRISSLSALTALVSPPILAFTKEKFGLFWVCLFLSLLIWSRHSSNIKRLLRGTEPRFRKKD